MSNYNPIIFRGEQIDKSEQFEMKAVNNVVNKISEA